MSVQTTHAITSAVLRSAVSTLILAGAAASAGLLLYLSFRFEAVAYAQILGALGSQPLFPDAPVTVAEGLAAGLNTAKIALIYVTAQHRGLRGTLRAIFPRAIHYFLITISLVMTLLVIGGETISPNAERRLAAEQDAIATRFAAEEARLEAEAEGQSQQIRQSFEGEQTLLSETHVARMTELQAGLDAERENIVNGEFYGPKYRDYERNIELERADFSTRTDALRSEERAAVAEVMARLTEERAGLRATGAEAQSGLSLASVFDVEEAQNPYLLRFLEIARYVTPDDVAVEIVLLTVVLSIMLSLGVEISPIFILGFVFRALGRPDEDLAAATAAGTDDGQNAAPINPANRPEEPQRSKFKVGRG